MSNAPETPANSGNTAHYDAIIIGAGISGMYQLHLLRNLGMSVRVFEAGTNIGGTWYWNRYPGARFDSESYSYGYSFSQEVLDEWDWSEHFAAQPEILRYLNFVADKFDFRKDIQFKTRIKSATFDEDGHQWQVCTENGEIASAQILISATGPLSAPQMPNIAGIDDFRGEAHHTGLWPHQEVDFTGKRVGIIGTGATAVQVIQTIADEVDHLTVFQRHPNYCAPLLNSKIDKAEMKKIRANYPDYFARCDETFGSFLHGSDPRLSMEVSDEERLALFEELYAAPGFAIWLGNFADTFTDQRANDLITEFMKKKIRDRVTDPEIAERLIPKDHGFGLRRVPMETNYYDVYNRDNVDLVDLQKTPITRITATGVTTSQDEREFDMIIYATGFNAVLGSLDRIEIRGTGGRLLKEKWNDGPRTFLGIQTNGFPNFFTVVGPHNGATFCNIPRCIEQNVEWVSDAVQYMRENNCDRMEASVEAENEWTKHVYDTAQETLFPTVDSWFMNVNRNLPEKKKTFLLYTGGNPLYREKCNAVAANNYEGFDMQQSQQD
jgi:cation diffusion facilitator CzcD-associated flavoprotein CzcO